MLTKRKSTKEEFTPNSVTSGQDRMVKHGKSKSLGLPPISSPRVGAGHINDTAQERSKSMSGVLKNIRAISPHIQGKTNMSDAVPENPIEDEYLDEDLKPTMLQQVIFQEILKDPLDSNLHLITRCRILCMPLNIDALGQALHILVESFDALRCRPIINKDGNLRVGINKEVGTHIETVQSLLEEHRSNEENINVNLSASLLMEKLYSENHYENMKSGRSTVRLLCHTISKEKHIIIFSVHRLIADVFSVHYLFLKLWTFYRNIVLTGEALPPEMPPKFKVKLTEETASLLMNSKKRLLNFWFKELQPRLDDALEVKYITEQREKRAETIRMICEEIEFQHDDFGNLQDYDYVQIENFLRDNESKQKWVLRQMEKQRNILKRSCEFTKSVRSQISIVDTEEDFQTPERVNSLVQAFLDLPLHQMMKNRGMEELWDYLESEGITDYFSILSLLPGVNVAMQEDAKGLVHDREWKKGELQLSRRESHFSLIRRVESIIALYKKDCDTPNDHQNKGKFERNDAKVSMRRSSKRLLSRRNVLTSSLNLNQRQSSFLNSEIVSSDSYPSEDEKVIMHFGNTDSDEDEEGKENLFKEGSSKRKTSNALKVNGNKNEVPEDEGLKKWKRLMELENLPKRMLRSLVLKVSYKVNNCVENVSGVLIPQLERKIRQATRDLDRAEENIEFQQKNIREISDKIRTIIGERTLMQERKSQMGKNTARIAGFNMRTPLFVPEGIPKYKYSVLSISHELSKNICLMMNVLQKKCQEVLDKKGMVLDFTRNMCVLAFNMAISSILIEHSTGTKNFLLPVETRNSAPADAVGVYSDLQLLNIDTSMHSSHFYDLMVAIAISWNEGEKNRCPFISIASNVGLPTKADFQFKCLSSDELSRALDVDSSVNFPLSSLISPSVPLELENVALFAVPDIPEFNICGPEGQTGSWLMKFFFLDPFYIHALNERKTSNGDCTQQPDQEDVIKDEEEKTGKEESNNSIQKEPLSVDVADAISVLDSSPSAIMFIGYATSSCSPNTVELSLKNVEMLIETIVGRPNITLENLFSRFFHSIFQA